MTLPHDWKKAAAFVIRQHMRAPRLTLAEDGVPKYSFYLDGLRREKTVDAAEIYRHRGAWKLKLVGAGYEAGLAKLCEDYGLSVE